ncbi:MAG: hypothetical protein Q8O76_10455 [Chloroflexota bacterium]|nr:hypothetical protein [Chloroflexota bacterium]
MVMPLRPRRGGFLRPFGCAWFIREYLLGHSPEGSPMVDPMVGEPQADIFYHYKTALLQATALDRATRMEEVTARRENRPISPDEIDRLTGWFLARLPYKTRSCRYHSFVVYFHNLIRLGWVEPTGVTEPSAFQEHYPPGPPRRYYRLTPAGKAAPLTAWANPLATLYPPH